MAEQKTPDAAPASSGEAKAAPAAAASEKTEAKAPAEGAAKQDAPGEATAQEVAAAAEPQTEDRVAKQLEEFAKQQQAIRRERQQLKREREEVEQAKKIRELAKTDRLAVLKELGIDPNDILQDFIANGDGAQAMEAEPSDPLVKRLADQIEKLQQKLTDKEKTEEQKQLDAQWARFCEGVKGHIKAKGDDFEILNSPVGQRMNLGDEVIAVIEGHYQATGETLDVDVAALLVEKKAEELLREVPKLKKFIPRTQPTEQKTGGSQQTGTNTITSTLAAPAGTKSEKRPKLSREESLKQALERFKNRGAAA